MEENKRVLLFAGDVHGYIPTFIHRLVDELHYQHADCVVCGDFGVGFDNSWDNVYQRISKKLEKNDVHIWVVRGNHDNPEYFSSCSKYSKEHVTFMEDYKIYTINGVEILPIGGATSHDRKIRLEKGWGWWDGEKIKRVELKSLPVKVDVIVTHQAPLVFDPINTKTELDDDFLYEEELEERKYLNEIAFNVKAKNWYYGHYHYHYAGKFKDINYTCLGIVRETVNKKDCPDSLKEMIDYKGNEIVIEKNYPEIVMYTNHEEEEDYYNSLFGEGHDNP